jgi:hypothetical protein
MRGHFMWVFVFLTIAFGGTLALAASHANRDTVEFIVRSKERVAMGNNSAKYLVFTNVETFEITDSLAENRFDSSDMYGYCEMVTAIAEKYTVGGFRSCLCTVT